MREMSEYKSRKARSCYTHVSDDGARVGFPPQFAYSTVCYNRLVLILTEFCLIVYITFRHIRRKAYAPSVESNQNVTVSWTNCNICSSRWSIY